MQRFDLGAHLHAQLGVEIGQRLVEQEHLRIAHDGATDGDALAPPAGELAGIAVGERAQSRDAGSLIDARIDGGLIGFAQLQLKAMLSRTLICG
jgi:hypothetical protein